MVQVVSCTFKAGLFFEAYLAHDYSFLITCLLVFGVSHFLLRRNGMPWYGGKARMQVD